MLNLFIVLAALLVATPAASGECLPWTQVNLLARYEHAMAYDSIRGVTVMLGGEQNSWPLSTQTWEWSGNDWTLRAEDGISPQPSPAAAFDSMRGVVVMFGGSQTWEWDGADWLLRAEIGPGPRQGHAMVYDEANNVTLLFGGSHSQSGGGGTVYDGDTWAWNGSNWTLLSNAGPPGRANHALAYDGTRDRVVLFAGDGPGITVFGDTWEWDGQQWLLQSSEGPRPRMNHAMTYHAARGRVVMTGGWFYGYDSATWEWDGQTWSILSSADLGSRANHAMVYDQARKVAVVFGGFDGATTLGDTRELGAKPPQDAQWSVRDNAPVPAPRWRHAMTYDTARGITVVFGGAVEYSYAVGYDSPETWEWDGRLWTLAATSGPSARSSGAMAFDSARNTSVLFGGYGDGHLGDTWEWDGRTWMLRATAGPSPRYGPAMAFDSSRKIVVLFGGESNNSAAGDTWEWDGRQWTQHQAPGPAPRYFHAMAYDAARGVTVLNGGYNNSISFADTWEWDGASWTLRDASSAPGPLNSHAMTFDATLGQVILFGGFQSAGFSSETWIWDGLAGQWNQIAFNGPIGRLGHGLVHDSERNVNVLFGGTTSVTGNHLNDTWESAFSGACADITGDGIVDIDDLLIIISAWGPCSKLASCPADLTGDGWADISDLLLVVYNWS